MTLKEDHKIKKTLNLMGSNMTIKEFKKLFSTRKRKSQGRGPIIDENSDIYNEEEAFDMLMYFYATLPDDLEDRPLDVQKSIVQERLANVYRKISPWLHDSDDPKMQNLERTTKATLDRLRQEIEEQNKFMYHSGVSAEGTHKKKRKTHRHKNKKGKKSRGRKSRGRKSRGRKSRGRKSRGR